MAEHGRAYWVLFTSRVRSQAGYRASFGLDLVGSMLVALTNLAEVYIVFHNVPRLGGLDFDAALLVFALAELSFGIANGIAGNLDTVPNYIRTGMLDVFLLRPLPLLGQLVTSEVTLKRIGQSVVSLVVLVVALARLDLTWSPGRVALVALTPICGALIFSAIFLLAGAAQFWLIDGGELTNGFTYGSEYASSFSAALMPLPLRAFFGFVIPAAFVGYLPALALLQLDGPVLLPAWLGWCGPVAAVGVWALALAAWRLGLRRYAGAGG